MVKGAWYSLNLIRSSFKKKKSNELWFKVFDAPTSFVRFIIVQQKVNRNSSFKSQMWIRWVRWLSKRTIIMLHVCGNENINKKNEIKTKKNHF